MTQEELYQKFDSDIAKRSRIMRFLLVLDQMFNVLIWNGSQDQTISGHIHRRMEEGKAICVEKKLCCVLQWFEAKHCFKSLGE